MCGGRFSVTSNAQTSMWALPLWFPVKLDAVFLVWNPWFSKDSAAYSCCSCGFEDNMVNLVGFWSIVSLSNIWFFRKCFQCSIYVRGFNFVLSRLGKMNLNRFPWLNIKFLPNTLAFIVVCMRTEMISLCPLLTIHCSFDCLGCEVFPS